MKLVVIFGNPAVGKLTVARELQQLSQWKLFHNHLVVDALLAVFEFGSRAFIDLRQRIWLDVFEQASRSGVEGMIFTFNPENTVAQEFISRLGADAAERGDSVHWVQLICSEATAESRLVNASRQTTKKLTSLKLYRELRESGSFNTPQLPEPELMISTEEQKPAESAARIWAALRSRSLQQPLDKRDR